MSASMSKCHIKIALVTKISIEQIICVVSRFPCAATARLLIRCGADINAMDSERNTPLHVIVGYSKAIRCAVKINNIQLYTDTDLIIF